MRAIIEWTKARNWPNLSREGHRIFLGDPQDGLNRAGFLVHRNFAGSLGDFKSRGRTDALNVDWQGKKFCALASHLHPYHDLEEYRKDLNDVKALTEMTPDRIVLWMVDAQTTLQAGDEDGWLIAGNTSNERTTKTEFFVDAVNSLWTSGYSTRGERGVSTIGLALMSIEKYVNSNFWSFQEFRTSMHRTDV